MKPKIIILVTIVIFTLSSCFPLVSPFQERTNPNDDKNYIPVAESFTATYNESNDTVDFSWVQDDPADYQWQRDAYIIIRRLERAPENVYDGFPVIISGGSDTTGYQAVDTDISDDYNGGCAEAGYVNYYGLFAYWKEDDSVEDLSIDTEQNYYALANTEGYVFSGPITDSVTIPATLELPLTDDTYITDAGQWFDDNYLTFGYDMAGTGEPTAISIMTFDDTHIQGATITGASLTLTNSEAFTYDDPTVAMVVQSWTTSDNWGTINNSSFISSDKQFSFPMGSTAADETNTSSGSKLVDIVQYWADGYDNYGLAILDEMAALTYGFSFWSENSGSGPVLEVTFMFED